MSSTIMLANVVNHVESIDPKIGIALRKFFELPAIANRYLVAPASTAQRFHHATDAGLLQHSLEVVELMFKVVPVLNAQQVTDSGGGLVGFWFGGSARVTYADMVIAGLLHDLHKIGDDHGNPWFVPNMLKNGSRSEKVPFETNVLKLFQPEKVSAIADTLTGSGHTEVYSCEQYITQNCWQDIPQGELSLALVYAYSTELFSLLSDDVKFAIRHHDGAYGKARRELTGNESPLQMLLHFADMWSSRLGEEKYR